MAQRTDIRHYGDFVTASELVRFTSDSEWHHVSTKFYTISEARIAGII